MIRNHFSCIAIIARLGSTRLNNKHLIKIKDKPIIGYLIERIKNEFHDEILNEKIKIFIITGNKKLNEPFQKIAKKFNISVFFGNDNNIPLRIGEVVSNQSFNSIICIDGDDIFCSPEGIRKVYKSIIQGKKYVKTIDYPFGMNSMGVARPFLIKALQGLDLQSLETGWGWIFNENECHLIGEKIESDERLRFTLDYPEDFSFFKKIIESLKEITKISTEDIIKFVINNQIYTENMFLNKEYWENFNNQKKIEMEGFIHG